MGLELFRSTGDTAQNDRSVADFIEDHYGSEAVDYLAEPLLSGVYGGNTRRLSAASVLGRFVDLETKYGSLTRGVLTERKRASASSKKASLFRTLKGGLGSLVEALEGAVTSSTKFLHGDAEALEKHPEGFRIRVSGNWINANHIVLACQAYQAGGIVGAIDAELASILDSIPYSSSMIVNLGYDNSSFSHPLNGFGFLVPHCERDRLVACTWVGTKFNHRVAETRVMLRCFLGGSEDPDILNESDGTVIAIVRRELNAIMGIADKADLYPHHSLASFHGPVHSGT